MTEALREWIMGVFGASLISAVALAITPKGKVRTVLRLLCGAVMVLALISPVLDFDFEGLSINLAQYRELGSQLETGAEETTQRLSRTVIEQECAAYILDKAQAMGLGVGPVSVSLKWGDDGCWYPYEVSASATEGEDVSGLSAAIEAELGVPAERQYWNYG